MISTVQRFKAVIVRIREPKATALIFHTGSMVCTGTKSVEDANRAAKHFGKAVQTALNKKVKFKDFKIQVGRLGAGTLAFTNCTVFCVHVAASRDVSLSTRELHLTYLIYGAPIEKLPIPQAWTRAVP